MNNTLKSVSALALAILPALALAAGNHGVHSSKHDGKAAPAGHDMAGMHEDKHQDAHESIAGTAGDPTQVSHTLTVEMDDTMRFTPDKISVKAGETVRFFIVNKGKVAHEMVIGTAEEIEEHAEMMRKMPNMVHKDANQIRLHPGQRGGIVWKFAKAGVVSYACMMPA